MVAENNNRWKREKQSTLSNQARKQPLNERQPKFKDYFMELFDNYGYLIPRNEFDKLLKLR